MDDLIPLAELLAEIDREIKRVPACTATLQRARSIAMTIPTIDAAPVVRCRDCMHSEIHRVRDGLFSETDVRKCELRAFLSIVVDDDDFCSNGERMDADEPERGEEDNQNG